MTIVFIFYLLLAFFAASCIRTSCHSRIIFSFSFLISNFSFSITNSLISNGLSPLVVIYKHKTYAHIKTNFVCLLLVNYLAAFRPRRWCRDSLAGDKQWLHAFFGRCCFRNSKSLCPTVAIHARYWHCRQYALFNVGEVLHISIYATLRHGCLQWLISVSDTLSKIYTLAIV